MARYRSKLTANRLSIEVGAAMRYMKVQKLHKNSPPLHWYGFSITSTCPVSMPRLVSYRDTVSLWLSWVRYVIPKQNNLSG